MEVDTLGITGATQKAMCQTIAKLSISADFLALIIKPYLAFNLPVAFSEIILHSDFGEDY